MVSCSLGFNQLCFSFNFHLLQKKIFFDELHLSIVMRISILNAARNDSGTGSDCRRVSGFHGFMHHTGRLLASSLVSSSQGELKALI